MKWRQVWRRLKQIVLWIIENWESILDIIAEIQDLLKDRPEDKAGHFDVKLDEMMKRDGIAANTRERNLIREVAVNVSKLGR